MKFSYAIDPGRKMIFLRYAGRFSLQGLLFCTQSLWRDPAYNRSYCGFIDLTDSALSVATSDLHALIAFLRERPELSEGRWAAVTTSPLATACGLVYQRALASRHSFEVFTSREAANNFLHYEGSDPALQECPVV